MRIRFFITSIFTLIVFLFVTACAPSSAVSNESYDGSEIHSEEIEESQESELVENPTPYSGSILCSPKKVNRLSYNEYVSSELAMIIENANAFATKFTPFAYHNYDKDNFVISPISIYMALGMLAECSNGQTKEQILSALDLSSATMHSTYSLLYRLLNVEYKGETYEGEMLTTGMLEINNSIWLDDDLSTKKDCLDSLGQNYYCNGIGVDFDGRNQETNNAIRYFIKKQSRGIIDKEYVFSEETLLTIINTLYLKDIWNDICEPLQKTTPISFTNADGTQEDIEMLKGRYVEGQAYRTQAYSGFYTKTNNGYKLKFILPNDGYTIDQVFTQENLQEFNSVEGFNTIDQEQRIKYYTRCFFPEYSTSYDEDIKGLLSEYFGITNLFVLGECDFGSLMEEQTYCKSLQHTVEFKVNEFGIEGAAVTLAEMVGAAEPDDYTEIFLDFVINKAFGFILTDPSGVIVFSGVVNSL